MRVCYNEITDYSFPNVIIINVTSVNGGANSLFFFSRPRMTDLDFVSHTKEKLNNALNDSLLAVQDHAIEHETECNVRFHSGSDRNGIIVYVMCLSYFFCQCILYTLENN